MLENINNYIDKLNTNQKNAVCAELGPVMVIAGAGSGKTQVLTSRYQYITEKYGFSPNEILAITFTNKAANEMKERLKKRMGEQKFLWVGTFHSICLKILKEDISVLNKDENFIVIDDDDQLSIIKDGYKRFSIENKDIPYKQVIHLLEKIKRNKLNYSDIKKEEYWDYLNIKNLRDSVNKSNIIKYYEEFCAQNNILDFNDLLIFANKVLDDNEVRNKWKNRFKYILIDEFQDTNFEQYDLIKKITNEDNNIFVVGDPDQMIYTWRGAHEGIITNFQKDFRNTQLIILDVNYRSTQEILDASNNLILTNKNRIKKELIAHHGYSKNKPIYFSADNQDQESNWVCKKIRKLLNDGVKPNEIAILYRSNYLSRNIEQELMMNNIKYKMHGGLKFYQRKEIKDVLAYLKSIFLADELSIRRIINTPRRGIGDAAIDAVNNFARENKTSFANALFHVDEIKDISKIATKGIHQFTDMLANIDLNRPLSKIFDQIINDTGYIEYLKENEEESKIPNIEELKASIIKYEIDNPNNTFIDYLQDISLLTDNDEKVENAISLMTVHISKGLEFNYVFIIGLNEDIFPSKQSKSSNGVDEERRIAYVAMTRAKKQLYFSSFGGVNYMYNTTNMPSRFIEEISNKFYEQDYERIKTINKANDDWFDSTLPKMSAKQRTEMFNNDVKHEFRIGDQVIHKTFGLGHVLKIDGNELTIFFNDSRQKKTIMSNHTSITRVVK